LKALDPLETDLSADEYQALAEFRYQIRRFLRLSEEAAAKAGVEARQYQFLLALKGLIQRKSVTIRDLAGAHAPAPSQCGRFDQPVG
jgi:hypothetical protein